MKKLKHDYGHSYFGSGGAWGAVDTCKNCRTVDERDNGFIRSPDGVEVIDRDKPAMFFARGGDDIGTNGREWSENGMWHPDAGEWI